jgi:hypothetical protein
VKQHPGEEITVPDEPNRLAAGLVAGALGFAGGFAAGYATRGARLADDDRPPIIVRGGSLHFENTTKKRPGKHWKQVNSSNKKEWELDDSNGKKVDFFHVFFVPSAVSTCIPTEAEEVVVDFDSDGNGAADRKYTIKLVNNRPVLIGTHDLELDTDRTKLIASLEGKIISVTATSTTGGSTTCASPTLVYLEPIKKR